MDKEYEIKNKYSLAAVINIFNNSLNVSEEKKLIDVEGVYLKQNSKEYNNHYYDRLKDIYSDKSLSLVIPQKIRESITHNYIYTFNGYINRRILDNGTIQINLWVNKILSDTVRANDENEIKAINIRTKKSLKNFKNFKLSIESKLLSGYKPRLALVLGNNAIVKDDIFNMLGNDINNYIIDEHRINLKSKEELINKIKEIDTNKNCDALIITRGGGTGLEIFNNIDVVEYLSNIDTILVTAIGHAADFIYLQNIADCNFDTPTALGSYLKNTSEKIMGIYSSINSEVNSLKKQINDVVEQKNKLDNEIKILNSIVVNKNNEIHNLNSKITEITEINNELSTVKKYQYFRLGFIVLIFILILIFK